jgi:hypothetical protein
MMLDRDERLRFLDAQERSFNDHHRVVDDTPLGLSRSAVLVEGPYISYIDHGVIEQDVWGRRWWRPPSAAEKMALLVEEEL